MISISTEIKLVSPIASDMGLNLFKLVFAVVTSRLKNDCMCPHWVHTAVADPPLRSDAVNHAVLIM